MGSRVWCRIRPERGEPIRMKRPSRRPDRRAPLTDHRRRRTVRGGPSRCPPQGILVASRLSSVCAKLRTKVAEIVSVDAGHGAGAYARCAAHLIEEQSRLNTSGRGPYPSIHESNRSPVCGS